tara:strand:- start:1140 stop:5375 length:4236 start_codon:yes stop_codon:yes gene_type:complete
METQLQQLHSLYQEVEHILQNSIGNHISVQSKIQKGFSKLESGKREFLNFILKERSKLSKTNTNTDKHNSTLMILDLYTKYPSYLDDAFLIKIENNKIINSYSQEYDTKVIAEQLYSIYDKKNGNGNTLSINSQIEKYNVKEGLIFPLTPMQKILRNLMNAETPYKGLMLIHGTGVGKTCTAIQIAENLKDFVIKMKTKIFVIRFDEFKRQIFENNKLRKGENVNLQCTGDTYIKEVEDITHVKDSILECKDGDESHCVKVEKAISKKINKYYDGYSTPYQWARMFQKLLKSKTRGLSGLEKHQKIIKVIRDTCNNSVLIIDEAHNLRNLGNTHSNVEKVKPIVKKGKRENEHHTKQGIDKNMEELLSVIDKEDTPDIKTNKGKIENRTEDVNFITKILQNVLLYSQNMRLILLSATPMYDKPDDIIPLLNFLRMNDKSPNIKKSQIFDKEKNLTASGKKILKDVSTGYISYVRGNDPLDFPIRLEANVNIPNKLINLKQYPEVDILGKMIAKKDRIKYMKLVKCPLNISHQNALLSIIGLDQTKRIENIKNDDVLKEDKQGNAKELANVKEDYSQEEFNLENEEVVEKNFSVAYNTEIQMSNFMYQTLRESGSQPRYCYGERGFNSICNKLPRKYTFKFEDEDMGKRFVGEGLKKHGPKLYECIQNIEKCDGPVFVYTYYTFGGVLPMAFALEMLGYTRYGGITPLLSNKHKSSASKGEYIIYTGDSQLRKGATKFFNLRQNMIKNKKVKVVIASKKGSEGLNLFGFREIHLLDPWHNINLLEQTIGRVIRRHSHHHLPPEKRNVVVYMYSTVMSGDKKHMESVDMRVYRICEKKALLSLDVLNILKKNAVDCHVTKAINYRNKKDYMESLTCITSHNKTIQYNPADNDTNKLYSVVDYNCFVEEDKKSMSETKFTMMVNDIKKQNANLDKTLIPYDIEISNILTIFKNLLIKNYNLHRNDSIDLIKDILPEKEKKNEELIINIYDVVIDNLLNKTLQLNISVNDKYVFGKVIKVKLSNNDEVLRLTPFYNQNPNISLYEQYYDYMNFLSTYNIENYSKLVRKKNIMASKNPYIFKPVNIINLEELIKDLSKIKSKFAKSQDLNYKNILLTYQNDIDNILYKKSNTNSQLSVISSFKSKLDKYPLKILDTSLNINNIYGFDELHKYVFDKLLINEKLFLLKNLIFRIKINDKLVLIEKILLNIIQFNLVNKNEFNMTKGNTLNKIKSQYYTNYIRNKDLLYGFIIADFDNLYLYKFNEELLINTDMSKSNNLDIQNFFTQDKIKLKSLMSKRWKIFSKQNLNNIYSHNSYSKSIYLKPNFKIIDYASKGYKKSVKGVNCTSNKLGQIISYMHKIDPKFKIYKVKNKKQLCNDLELLTRIKHNMENPDLTAPGITLYFLSPEEYYIWNYYK